MPRPLYPVLVGFDGECKEGSYSVFMYPQVPGRLSEVVNILRKREVKQLTQDDRGGSRRSRSTSIWSRCCFLPEDGISK